MKRMTRPVIVMIPNDRFQCNKFAESQLLTPSFSLFRDSESHLAMVRGHVRSQLRERAHPQRRPSHLAGASLAQFLAVRERPGSDVKGRFPISETLKF